MKLIDAPGDMPCLSDDLCLQSVPCPGGLAYLIITLCIWSTPSSYFQVLEAIGSASVLHQRASRYTVFYKNLSSKVLLTSQFPFPHISSTIKCFWHFFPLWNQIWILLPIVSTLVQPIPWSETEIWSFFSISVLTFILLKYSWFTVLCSFLVYSQIIQFSWNIYNSLHLLISNSQSIPPPPTLSLSNHKSVPCVWVCFCFINKFICVIF